MPFDGNGNFTPASPEYPAIAGTTILADDWNTIVQDLADGLSLTVTRDGQSAMQADLPMAGFLIKNLGDGTQPNDATTYRQVFTNPTFSTPRATTSPAWNDATKLLATMEAVQSVVTHYGSLYSPAISMYMYQNY